MSNNVNGWLIAVIIMDAIALLISANQHGKPRGDYNFWATLFAVALNLTITFMAVREGL